MGKIIKVREVGDPVLNKISEEVDITNINNDILDIIDDLKATLEDGVGLGIAAPQIGISKRIIVVGAKKENVRYNDAEDIPLTAMINPKWEKSANDTDIQFYNEQGEKIEREIHGFFARLIQHECDHLDGFTLLNRVTDKAGFATKENRKKYNL